MTSDSGLLSVLFLAMSKKEDWPLEGSATLPEKTQHL